MNTNFGMYPLRLNFTFVHNLNLLPNTEEKINQDKRELRSSVMKENYNQICTYILIELVKL